MSASRRNFERISDDAVVKGPSRNVRTPTNRLTLISWTMNRHQLLNRLDTAWVAFQSSYADLSNTQLTEPGVVGDWSVQDIIAHVTWWEEEAL